MLNELRTRGVNVEDVELSYTIPGGRLQPDAIFKDNVQYYLELEVGKATKIFDGLKQAGKYVRNLPCVGAFVVLLPEELRTPMPRKVLEELAQTTKCEAVALYKDQRIISPFEGKLANLADWIAQEILTPPERRTFDTGHLIRILRKAVDYISIGTSQLRMEELEDVFGGRSIFDNILQYEEQKYPIEELRKAVTYLLLNQIIFYTILSNEQPDRYKPIDETALRRPGDLMLYFGKVLEVDYKPIFGFDVLQKFPQGYLDNLKDAILAVKELHPEKIRYDLLGKIFHDLIPFEIRKSVAAFYTNNEGAELLANLSVEKSDDSVMDLACGSGTLLVAAYHRKRALLEAQGMKFGPKDHEKFVKEDLTGIDVMPFAAHLAVVHLSLQGPLYTTEKVRIAVWDSTHPTIRPGNIIPSISRELRAAYKSPKLEGFFNSEGVTIPTDQTAYMEKGVVTADRVGGDAIRLDRVNVVIMNPPFTRQERLPAEYKLALRERFLEYKKYLHGQMGLWGYFILLADRFVKNDGRIALILPGRILRSRSALKVREFLAANYHVQNIISSTRRWAFSESAYYKDFLLIARKKDKAQYTANDHDEETKITLIHEMPESPSDAQRLADIIRQVHHDKSSAELSTVVVDTKELTKNLRNWYIFISAFNSKTPKIWSALLSSCGNLLSETEYYLQRRRSSVIRGVETKKEFGIPFFATFIIKNESQALKKYDNWIVENETGRTLSIKNRTTGTMVEVPKSAFSLAVRRASGQTVYDLSKRLDYLVTKHFDNLPQILAPYESATFIRKLGKWETYLDSRKANLLVSRRFDLASPGTAFLAFFSETPTTGQNLWSIRRLPIDEAKIQTLWFNSTMNLLQVYLNRTESRASWMEINEYSLCEGYMVDTNKLRVANRSKLLQLFDKYKQVQFPSIMKQLQTRYPPRLEIDRTLLIVLGANDQFIDEFERSAYDLLAAEIHKLSMMI